ncbi:MAG: hypothetical protein CSA81_03665 [Acidobacteria bacterium]|nr:MAG: hypothetical protein CSA81_03665 [Acidobacteriota bacterium]
MKKSKEEKKKIRQKYKEEIRAKNRQNMGLSKEEIETLLIAVEGALTVAPCDHSLRHTSDWARKNGITWDSLKINLQNYGCYCDCELLFNLDLDDFFKDVD